MSIQAFLHTEKKTDHGILSNVSDLFLAVGIVAIIALMVLPLPLLVLDALVALNIVIGLILVLMGVYITSPLQFSVFPSVLLISTLYRLALSVATTRMILLHGDAGHIIDTFGNMVAGGNIVVGLVVFLIITLVQFIVIAKGAERVAEVAARFTLDAMPGKQLSIDSDLRSGLIDKDEAKRKRREIELESKLHGSMDGAMKFVKGDAIAGIVIIIINLIGGLAIGVLQLDMDMSAAMAKYSILTVGDGMVAQIPALLGAMSAGLIVTRATDEKSDRHLGDSIQKQLTAIPRVTLVAGGLCMLLALVPGFPSGIFVGIGALLLLSGALLVPFWKSKIEKVTKPTFEVILSNKDSTSNLEKVVNPITEVKPAVPLLLQLPVELSDTEKSKNLMIEIEKKVNEYQVDIGILLPKINLHWYGDKKTGWQLLAYEVPIISDSFEGENILLEMPIKIREALRRNITLFLGLQETSTMLTQQTAEIPDIIKEVLRIVPMQSLSTILRNLIEEEIPIRNLRGILEALIETGQHEKDINNLTEYSRIALRRQITHRYAPSGVLQAVILTPELEEKLLQSVRVTSGVVQMSLQPQQAEKIIANILASIQKHNPTAIVTSVQIRRHIRKMIENEAFDVPVLSHNELLPTININIVERVNVRDLLLEAV
ncbi:MAG: FHIPEP family type III secretion protein [Candidatus Thiodiazotropha lotti]|nr:FHIPEP family type III secretion protein [Candidatus Thiodiazotropha lotti]MCW4218848.1 FHIPEP family type III secretion protein [Candidatus Thiodiazotropha lotti]